MTPSPKSYIFMLKGRSGNNDFNQLAMIVLEGTSPGVPGLPNECFSMYTSQLTNSQIFQFLIELIVTLHQIYIFNHMMGNTQQYYNFIHQMYKVYNIKFNKQMIINAQLTADVVVQDVIHSVEKNICIIERVKRNKLKYSALRTVGVFNELTDQIDIKFDDPTHLRSPLNNQSLRLDSYMSVFKVDHKNNVESQKSIPQITNHLRRHTSVQSQIQSARKLKKNNKYDNIQSLNLPSEQNQLRDPNEQVMEDMLRNDLQKSIQKKQSQKKTSKKKILSPQELREIFTYDYQFNRVKVALSPQPKLVNPLKSLLGKISRSVEKKQSIFKVINPPNIRLKTTKIMEQVKRKETKPRKINIQQEIENEQDTKVEFSQIGTLTQKLDCEPGVIFSSQGQTIKNKKRKKELDIKQTNNSSLRLSKLDYMVLKQRSKTSISQIQQKSKETIRTPKSYQSLQREIDFSSRELTKNTIYNRKMKSKGNQQKILVQNLTMHQFLLTPDRLPLILNQNGTQSQVNQDEQEKSTILLDDNDKFNMSYIKGLIKPSKAMKNSQQNTTVPIQQLRTTRNVFLRAREKVFGKKATIKQMKRKFEQTLKERQSRLNR